MKTKERKPFDFETAPDPVTMDRLFALRGKQIDEQIHQLERAKDRYTNPEIPAKIAALEAERAEREAARAEREEAFRVSWLGDGHKVFSDKLSADENALDNEILALLDQVKELAHKRTELAFLRDQSQKKYGRWLVAAGQLDRGTFYRGLDTYILTTKLHVPPDAGQGAFAGVLKIFLDHAQK